MRRLVRMTLGMALGGVLLLLLWAAGIVEPPEGISRRLAIIAATRPGPGGPVSIERVPCGPLKRLRFYVVCTDDCEGVWRIVGVRGLAATTLANLNALPPDPPEAMRRAANDAIAAERLDLREAGARDLIGCYMRLAGLRPERVLAPDDLQALKDAGESGPDRDSLMERLDEAGAIDRLPIQPAPGGFATRFDYWDTDSPGAPVLEMTWGLRRDGTLASYDSRVLILTDDSASGSTPDTPPI